MYFAPAHAPAKATITDSTRVRRSLGVKVIRRLPAASRAPGGSRSRPAQTRPSRPPCEPRRGPPPSRRPPARGPPLRTAPVPGRGRREGPRGERPRRPARGPRTRRAPEGRPHAQGGRASGPDRRPWRRFLLFLSGYTHAGREPLTATSAVTGEGARAAGSVQQPLRLVWLGRAARLLHAGRSDRHAGDREAKAARP